MIEIALLPSGNLTIAESDGPGVGGLPESLGSSLRKAFERSASEGLLHVATFRHDAALPASLSFWRGFGERYLTALCHIPEPGENLTEPIAPPVDDLAAMAAAAPPMRGGEYLRTEILERLWTEMDNHTRAEIAKHKGGLSEWLKALGPLWHRVGRVSFHLAENKRDQECPFAFLATYAPRLLDGRRVQYQPLGQALEEYAGARNRKGLINLLTPIQRAAERSPWVKALVDSGEVFHPLRWTPDEAYRFLKDVPLLEESGLPAGASLEGDREGLFEADGAA